MNKEGLDKEVEKIGTRQRLIENDDRDWGPICMFAEGSVTNGKNLSRFRRGAFEANVAVQPVYFKYDYKTVSPDYATLKAVELSVIMASEFAL